MNKFGYFLYKHKLILLNMFLAVFIAAMDPKWFTQLIPDSPELDYYSGVILLALMFLEVAAIHFKTRWLYSFPQNLDRRTPLPFYFAFVPRVALSYAMMMLVLDAMGVLEKSDFFLVLIIVYGTAKELWVRGSLLNSVRDATIRPKPISMWLAEISFFLFVAGIYVALWEIYLVEHEQVMFRYLNERNFWLIIPLFGLTLLSLEMPYFFEEYRRNKKRSEKVIAGASLLLPLLAFVFILLRFNNLIEL